MKKVASRVVAAASLFALTGCASIVSKSQWPVSVTSNPAGAKCTISKTSGVAVHTGNTPMVVTLDSSDGFFSSADYTLSCEKEGYATSEAKIEGHLNGWYWGNIVFGGVIGLFIVDPATGAMWRLDDTAVVNLEAPIKAAQK